MAKSLSCLLCLVYFEILNFNKDYREISLPLQDEF